MAIHERSSFGDLLEPGLRKIYDSVYASRPQMYTRVFDVMTSDKESEKDSSVTGFGLLSKVAEQAEFPSVEMYQGFDKTYTHIKYGGIFSITQELYDDDLYNIINKKPKELAQSASDTVEHRASSVLRNAQSTSFTGADGVPLASTVHPREDGGSTQSNASSTGITLTEANLETGRLALRNQLNQRGLPANIGEKPMLLVPPALEKTAVILTQSDGRPTTADNDLNFYKGTIADVMVWDWVGSNISAFTEDGVTHTAGSDTAWCLINNGATQLNFFWRKKPSFEQDTLLSTEVSRFKVSMRFSYGFSNWRGFWRSAGDGSAYSD